MEWLLFAFAAAVFTTLMRVLIKVSKSSDNETILFSKYFYALFPVLILLLIVGWQSVPREFYYWISIAVVFEVLAMTSMIFSLKHSAFSRSLPMISFAPIFALFTAYLFLGEMVSLQGFIGIFIIVAGVYYLSYGDHKGLMGPFKSLYYEKGPKYMLLTAFLFGFLSVFWKKSLLLGGVNMTIILGTILPTILVLGFFLVRGELVEVLPNRKDFWKLFFIGIFAFGTIYSVLLGFEVGFISYVSGIKKFSILFGVIIGAVFFRERHAFRHIIASLIMVLGAVLVVLG